MKRFISIDVGGTAIKYGLINEDGIFLEKGCMNTEASSGGPAVVRKVKGIVERYTGEHPAAGICISTAGMVDVEKGGVFYSSPLIPSYAGTCWKAVMEEDFGIPCEVENDVNCAGLAEAICGAAKDSRLSVCLTIGTGIGGCVLIDKRVLHGYSNSACEVGYLHLTRGEFQESGAVSALSRKVAEQKQDRQEQWSGYRIFEEAEKGDDICCQAIEEMTDVLGEGIANICYVLNPQIIVLGGGVMEQEAYLLPRIRTAMEKYLIGSIASKTLLCTARHGNDAGMLGAFYHFLFRQKLWKQ